MNISRRHLVSAGTTVAAMSTVGAMAATSLVSPTTDKTHNASQPQWFGLHQPGIAEEPPAFARVVGLNLRPMPPASKPAALKRVLTLLSGVAMRTMAGELPLADDADELADNSSHTTFTIGLGPAVFDSPGLKQHRPDWLQAIPPLPIDKLQSKWAQPEIIVQICSDDPLTLSHATNQILQHAEDDTKVLWQQAGFRPPAKPGDHGIIRNTFGQIDGTVQPDIGMHPETLWHEDGPDWLKGGTSFVLRRIDMDVPTWDTLDRDTRENAMGRHLSDGSPLSGGGWDAVVNLGAKDQLGFPLISEAAHVRQAMPQRPGEKILRRPYLYDDAENNGHSGLLFIAYQADIGKQFVPIQKRLAENDLMNIWTTPVGSTVAVIPGGAQPGEYVGQRLLES